jgi:gamma-glutamylcyclotransferase (GGCT)/AIG2-like uncharacterized protein YtfP
MNTYPLFVYGSLMKGFGLHWLLEDSISLGRGSMKGFDLFSLGAYPCVKRREEGPLLHGELYLVNQELLRKLDPIEGAYSRDLYPLVDGRFFGIYVWKGAVPSWAVPLSKGVWDPQNSLKSLTPTESTV